MRGDLPDQVLLPPVEPSQYPSHSWHSWRGVAQSVGYTDVYWDNAHPESLWATSKVEFYNRSCGRRSNLLESLSAIRSKRSTTAVGIIRCLGVVSPAEFRERFTQMVEDA